MSGGNQALLITCAKVKHGGGSINAGVTQPEPRLEPYRISLERPENGCPPTEGRNGRKSPTPGMQSLLHQPQEESRL